LVVLIFSGVSLPVRGTATVAHAGGIAERIAVTEFDSIQQAISTFEGDAYRATLKCLGDAVERDLSDR
jgi:uncharacterized protein (DUF1330 family)